MELVLATQNPGKVIELADLLAEAGVKVLARPVGLAETIEDADTLVGNASKKANEISMATGLAALADDTGLFVDALDGAPGVFTARFGGWKKLLESLEGVDRQRSAQFRTVLVIAYPDGRPDLVVDGVCEGKIAQVATGDGGFGYDPVFIPADGDGRSFAEMTKAEKNQISHRARALQGLLAHL